MTEDEAKAAALALFERLSEAERDARRRAQRRIVEDRISAEEAGRGYHADLDRLRGEVWPEVERILAVLPSRPDADADAPLAQWVRFYVPPEEA